MKNTIHLLFILSFNCVVTFGQSPSWQWAKRAGGSGTEFGRSICIDSGGNVYVTGGFQSGSITFGSFTLIGGGGQDGYIVKYDANGNVLWAEGITGLSYDFASGICTDSSGNVFVTGNTQSDSLTMDTLTVNLPFGIGGGDLFIAKLNTNGNIQWIRTAQPVLTPPSWGISSVSTDISGNCYVTGAFFDTISFGNITLVCNNWDGDLFITKYDPAGNVLWAKSSTGSIIDLGIGISTDVFGNAFVTGDFKSSSITFDTITLNNSGGQDLFIAKYDMNGNVLWATNAAGSGDEDVKDISSDTGGNVFITGYFTSASVTFGSITLTNTNSPLTDLFIAKYDGNGNVLWAKSTGGSDFEYGNGISTDASGNSVIVGSFLSPAVTFGSYTLNNFSSSSSDIFVAKYDSAGNASWAKSIPAVWDNYGRDVAINSCNVYITGEYNSLSMVVGNDTLNNSGSTDIYVAKLSCDTITGMMEDIRLLNVFIYPNPFTKFLNIYLYNNQQSEIILYDILSRKLLQQMFTNSITLNTELLAKGLYLYEVRDRNGTCKKGKVVKD